MEHACGSDRLPGPVVHTPITMHQEAGRKRHECPPATVIDAYGDVDVVRLAFEAINLNFMGPAFETGFQRGDEEA